MASGAIVVVALVEAKTLLGVGALDDNDVQKIFRHGILRPVVLQPSAPSAKNGGPERLPFLADYVLGLSAIMHEGTAEESAREQARRHLAMRAMQLIQHRLSDELSVEQLAEELGVSWSTLAHVFPGVTGETVWQHIRRIRLERAARNLLVSPDANVLDVAIACGFESHSSFTRAFKQAFGCSPRAFRKKKTNHPVIEAANNVHDGHFAGHDGDDPVDVVALNGIPWLPHELDVRIQNRPPVRLAVVRDVGEYEFSFIARVLLRMLVAAWRQGLMTSEARFYGVSYEDPYLVSRGQISYEAGITIPDETTPLPPLSLVTLPAGRWACLDCQGPPAKHFASWNRFIFQWLPDGPWTMSHGLVAQQFHLPGNLLHHPAQLIGATLRGFSATELIPVRPGPRGSLLPI